MINASQPGGYHKPDNGLAANGAPLSIVGDQSGICLKVKIDSFKKKALG
jgi:hypothetical protein